MKKLVNVATDGVEKSIIAVGKSLIDRASEIARDIDKVNSISITAVLNPCEIVTFKVEKEYTATLEEKEDKDGKN